MRQKAFLVLEDGAVFTGYRFGYSGNTDNSHTDSSINSINSINTINTIGEVVFNTSMSGYQEILTDPSYTGQIIAMTYPMIGNYGVNEEDVESDRVQAAGLIVKEYSKTYSNYRAVSSLDEYLNKNRVPGIEGIDTRKLTRYIRDKGAMRAGIFSDSADAVKKLLAHPCMEGLDLTTEVMCAEKYHYSRNISGAAGIRLAVFDFGVKTNILRLLHSTGFDVWVYPGNTPLAAVRADGMSAVFLSNGPGDPDAVPCGRQLVRDIIAAGIPAFGICLGHQIMGLGLGGKTYKLKFGHRGANQPVKNSITGRVDITSQNHGFAVDADSLTHNHDVLITDINLNDHTVEGLRHKTLPILSVQHHPEACPGPHDAMHLFREFYAMAAARCSA